MPGRESWTGDTHILLLTEVREDEFGYVEWEYELLHPPVCKQVPDELGVYEGEVILTKFDCDVAWHEYQESLADAISYSGSGVTQPGSYRIRGGVNVYDTESGPETDTGLAVAGV